MEFSSISKSLNRQQNVLSLFIHVESLEKLIKVFWVIFSVFGIKNFKKLAYNSVNRRQKTYKNTSI